SSPPPNNVSTTATATATATATDAAAPQTKTDKAHRLLVASTGCWLGGIWAQAEGDWTVAAKRTGDEARCKEVLFQAGLKDDDLAALRAIDPKVTDPVAAKIEAFAKEDGFDDGRTKNLRKLFDAIIASQREAFVARRAADRVKLDFE